MLLVRYSLVVSTQTFPEGADSVGAQMCGDNWECPVNGTTVSGRVWKKVPESEASEYGFRPNYLVVLLIWLIECTTNESNSRVQTNVIYFDLIAAHVPSYFYSSWGNPVRLTGRYIQEVTYFDCFVWYLPIFRSVACFSLLAKHGGHLSGFSRRTFFVTFRWIGWSCLGDSLSSWPNLIRNEKCRFHLLSCTLIC